MQPTHALHRGNYGLVRCQEAACGQRLELAECRRWRPKRRATGSDNVTHRRSQFLARRSGHVVLRSKRPNVGHCVRRAGCYGCSVAAICDHPTNLCAPDHPLERQFDLGPGASKGPQPGQRSPKLLVPSSSGEELRTRSSTLPSLPSEALRNRHRCPAGMAIGVPVDQLKTSVFVIPASVSRIERIALWC